MALSRAWSIMRVKPISRAFRSASTTSAPEPRALHLRLHRHLPHLDLSALVRREHQAAKDVAFLIESREVVAADFRRQLIHREREAERHPKHLMAQRDGKGVFGGIMLNPL